MKAARALIKFFWFTAGWVGVSGVLGFGPNTTEGAGTAIGWPQSPCPYYSHRARARSKFPLRERGQEWYISCGGVAAAMLAGMAGVARRAAGAPQYHRAPQHPERLASLLKNRQSRGRAETQSESSFLSGATSHKSERGKGRQDIGSVSVTNRIDDPSARVAAASRDARSEARGPTAYSHQIAEEPT